MNPSESAPEAEMLRSHAEEFVEAEAVRRAAMARRIFGNGPRP
jgi:hypothetical protein